MKPILICPIIIGFTLGTGALSGGSIFDDFNDGNDTSPPWGFRDVTDQGQGGLGSRGFGPDGKRYQLSGPATASIRGDLWLGDGEVRCEMSNWNPSVQVGSSVGILARFDPNTLSGYFLSIDADGSPNLNLVKLVNGVPSGGDDLPSKPYNSGSTYILQMLLEGGQITCRIFLKGDPNTLIDELVWTDPNPFGPGYTGLLVANDTFPNSLLSATAMFDNFFATDGNVAAPALSGTTIVNNAFQFAFGIEPGHMYAVEYKLAVGDAWLPLTVVGPEPFSGARTATDPLNPGHRIYQVRVVDDSP